LTKYIVKILSLFEVDFGRIKGSSLSYNNFKVIEEVIALYSFLLNFCMFEDSLSWRCKSLW